MLTVIMKCRVSKNLIQLTQQYIHYFCQYDYSGISLLRYRIETNFLDFYSVVTTLAATGPLAPFSIENVTFCPSNRVR